MIRALLDVLGEDLARPVRRSIAWLSLAAVLQGIGLALVVPLLVALGEGDADRAWWWLAALVACVIGWAIASTLSQYSGYLAAIGLSRGLFRKLADHLVALPLGWFAGGRAGQIAELSSGGVSRVMSVPAHLLGALVSEIVTPLTIVIVLALYDWKLALAACAVLPLALLVQRSASKVAQHAARRLDGSAAEASDRVIEFARNQHLLRAFGRQTTGHELLDRALVEQRDASRALVLSAVPAQIAYPLAVNASLALILVVGVHQALDGAVSAPVLVALLVLGVRFTEPLLAVSSLATGVKIAGNTLGAMQELLATPTLAEPTEPVALPAAPTVALDRVSFAYRDGDLVLDDVSFDVSPGTLTALVGPSGAGKSTVLQLLARFWDARSGTVRCGGIDVRDVASDELAQAIAIVFQETYLLDTTIRENVELARPDASAAEFDRAVRVARVDEIVERLPDGWETRVGEAGVLLSGGERQRVALARALLKDAPVVLLDEATSALDAINELAVRDALATFLESRTVVVVAHRLQTIAAADQIVFLEGGRVCERGTHASLLARGGRYADFWEERAGARGWRLGPTANRSAD